MPLEGCARPLLQPGSCRALLPTPTPVFLRVVPRGKGESVLSTLSRGAARGPLWQGKATLRTDPPKAAEDPQGARLPDSGSQQHIGAGAGLSSCCRGTQESPPSGAWHVTHAQHCTVHYVKLRLKNSQNRDTSQKRVFEKVL